MATKKLGFSVRNHVKLLHITSHRSGFKYATIKVRFFCHISQQMAPISQYIVIRFEYLLAEKLVFMQEIATYRFTSHHGGFKYAIREVGFSYKKLQHIAPISLQIIIDFRC